MQIFWKDQRKHYYTVKDFKWEKKRQITLALGSNKKVKMKLQKLNRFFFFLVSLYSEDIPQAVSTIFKWGIVKLSASDKGLCRPIKVSDQLDWISGILHISTCLFSLFPFSDTTEAALDTLIICDFIMQGTSMFSRRHDTMEAKSKKWGKGKKKAFAKNIVCIWFQRVWKRKKKELEAL